MVLFSPTAIAYADDTSRPGESAQWSGGLEWMEGNTPDPGLYGNPDGDQFDMDGTYKVTDDFDYPDGTYGVLSWWDYGHYITSDAKRIPTANPFQQGVRPAADFLLAQNESEAMDVLSEIDESDNAQAQYVMVDWKMVNTDAFRPVSGKFFAPPDFHDEFERSDFYTRVIDQQLAQDRGIISATSTMLHKQPYYNAMMTRLYKYHGSAQQPRPYVVEWQGAEQQLNEDETFVTSSGPSIQFYDSLRAAQQAVENSSSAQIGGFGPYPAERVPALEHFRLVHMSNLTALAGGEGFNFQRTVQNNRLGSRLVQQLPQYNGTSPQAAAQDFLYGTNPAWTKTFERVPGATIEGTGPANRSVLLSVELKPENGQQFTYTQSVDVGEDGQFNTTVPYATTGDDEYGVEEGYTNSTIEAQTPYRLSAPGVNDEGNQTFFIGEVNVTEGQVLGEESGPDPVELEPIGESDLIDTGDDGSDSESDDSGSEGTNSSSESESVDGTAGVQPQLTWTERQFAASAG
jgi:dolichyl-diphosphooligosaccharide--protein glycosyltransferase